MRVLRCLSLILRKWAASERIKISGSSFVAVVVGVGALLCMGQNYGTQKIPAKKGKAVPLKKTSGTAKIVAYVLFSGGRVFTLLSHFSRSVSSFASLLNCHITQAGIAIPWSLGFEGSLASITPS